MERTIIVTGASRGIGAAIAYELAGRGYTVGCISRSGQLPQISNADADILSRCRTCAADVTDPDAFHATIHELARSAPPLAGLVNNAGYHDESPSAEMPMEQWASVMEANAGSVVIGSQAIYPLLKSDGGLIVNIGSFFDKLGVRKNLAYCASKAAVGAITRVLAVEWARDRIAVVNVAPGYILTDLNREEWDQPRGALRAYLQQRIPGRKPGMPEDIAAVVANLFALPGTFLSGETIYVDGGQTLVV